MWQPPEPKRDPYLLGVGIAALVGSTLVFLAGLGCLGLLAVSLLPTLIGLAGGVYFAGALVLGAGFVTLGAQQALAPSASRVRRVLLASLLYLPALLALLAFDKA